MRTLSGHHVDGRLSRPLRRWHSPSSPAPQRQPRPSLSLSVDRAAYNASIGRAVAAAASPREPSAELLAAAVNAWYLLSSGPPSAQDLAGRCLVLSLVEQLRSVPLAAVQHAGAARLFQVQRSGTNLDAAGARRPRRSSWAAAGTCRARNRGFRCSWQRITSGWWLLASHTCTRAPSYGPTRCPSLSQAAGG